MAQVFSSPVGAKNLDCPAELVSYFLLKFFELFKGFTLMFQQIYVTVSAEVINEGNEVWKTSSSGRVHWATYISMYDSQ